MMRILIKLFTIIDKLNDWIGKIVSILIFPMIFILFYEVVMRYLFNMPTLWAHELSGMMYAVFILFGGVYALKWNNHVNVEILYNKLKPRVRALVDIFTWALFYLFCFVLFWDGFDYAQRSIMIMEHSTSVWEPPIWPVKICIPLTGILMILQGLVKTIKDLIILIKGEEFLINNIS